MTTMYHPTDRRNRDSIARRGLLSAATACGTISMTLTDDPELVAARAVMAEESLVDAIAKALSKAPSLTRAVRERINALLDGAS
jgi:hypothetical protein